MGVMTNRLRQGSVKPPPSAMNVQLILLSQKNEIILKFNTLFLILT